MGRRGKREGTVCETVAMCITLALAFGLLFMAMHACWETRAAPVVKPADAAAQHSKVTHKSRRCPKKVAAAPPPAEAVAPPALPSSTVPDVAIHGTVIAVYDGDTVTVEDDCGETYQLRLHGIDAPERKQDFGYMARLALSGMVLGKRVAIMQTTKDRYGRMVGRLFVAGNDVNCAMVRNGHAWHYSKYAPDDTELSNAEEFARRNRLGIWSVPVSTPPWVFRKQHVQTVSGAVSPPPDDAEGPYWISGTGKTHNSTCRYYEATVNGHHSSVASGNDCEICGGAAAD